MWNFQSLLDAGGVTLEAAGLAAATAALSDGDWSRLQVAPGLVRGGARAVRAPWTEGWGGGGNREAGGGSQLLVRRVLHGGPGGKKERRTPKCITRGREWQLSRVGRGTSGAGGGVGGSRG